MANDALFLELSKALARPSGAYRAATEALDIPKQAIEGYKYGADFGDSLRKRKLQQQTLADALGGQDLEAGIRNMTAETGDLQSHNVNAEIALLKANRELPERSYTAENYFGELLRSGKMTPDQYAELKQKSSPSMFPKPEPGTRFGPNGSLVPIPGGSLDRELADKEAKKQAADDAKRTEADLAIKKIDEALGQVDGLSAGGMAATAKIPLVGQMTGATDLSSNLDTIISSLGIGKLMEMKANSKAGASGMGALSDREMTLLTSALTSLKQSQRPEQLRKHLGDVKTHYQNILQMNQGVNPFGDQTGDAEADAAIARINAAPIDENQKKARISAVRARATRGQ